MRICVKVTFLLKCTSIKVRHWKVSDSKMLRLQSLWKNWIINANSLWEQDFRIISKLWKPWLFYIYTYFYSIFANNLMDTLSCILGTSHIHLADCLKWFPFSEVFESLSLSATVIIKIHSSKAKGFHFQENTIYIYLQD